MIDKNNIPKHIAIIMDGNGRWAKARKLTRASGHRAGAKRVREIVEAAGKLGVKVVTFFVFSAENWSRPKREVDILMRYLEEYLDKELAELMRNNIRFLVIGRADPLPGYIQKKIKAVEEKTADNTGLTMVLALNYGARQEIVDAAARFTDAVMRGEAQVNDLDEKNFGGYLYTAGLPDPDLFIRTSAELRLSNFLLWQLSYAELYFTKKFWPDFGADDLKEAIEEYQSRERRFGGI